ncbi:Nucleolar pre-ribosomal-associated 1 [Brachionus plicatilis]|uniref:Nucleolar pre-ribosomal-associated 1 n=1 Tax=Brachionus plicatilis TaxID=10195 RepID=A0A3M7RWM6_BRAPC|nr:Nucleolar pre-ribosomal-associated 1 [Brachionus plicatilis]
MKCQITKIWLITPNVVDVLQFIQSNCLAYLFSSLSSDCAKLRMLAYGSLFRFVSHLENSRVYCKNIILYVIDLLRNSLDKENQRVSSVISVFLAETVSIIVEPGHKLYKPLVSFYLLKPVLDLANVPEFYKFFNSSSLEFREERRWIMTVLVSGIRSSLEYRLYQKRFIYRQLLSIYESKMSDNDLKSLILDLLIKTCESKYALIDLVKKHFFIIWLSSVLNSLLIDEKKIFLFIKMLSIYNLVWKQLGAVGADERLPLGFLNQMLALGKIIKAKLSSSGVKFEEMFKWENSDDEQQRCVLEGFFKASDCVMREISKYEIGHRDEMLSLSETIETSERKIQNGELDNYSDLVSFVVSRKRTGETCSQIFWCQMED